MKVTKEKFKTYKDVFDRFTIRNLFRLSTQGYFDDPEKLSPVSIGKESNVFSAQRGSKKVIVKIYRLEVCDFNRMYDYIKYDPRYPGMRNQRRKVIFSWVQREYRNLLKAREAGVRVPTPLTFMGNILVEEMIGRENASPKLKDAIPADLNDFFEDTLKQVRKLYCKAGLIHADLSHFNILNFEEKPVIIDLSTCTPLDNTLAKEYLARDVRNICNFFRKHGLETDEDETRRRIQTKEAQQKI